MHSFREHDLTKEEIKTGMDGNLWIMDTRNKTGVPYKVRLLDIPTAILKKYEYLQDDGRLLPVISNQKMNEYLYEIATVCGIHKKITCHVARHINLPFRLETNELQSEFL